MLKATIETFLRVKFVACDKQQNQIDLILLHISDNKNHVLKIIWRKTIASFLWRTENTNKLHRHI